MDRSCRRSQAAGEGRSLPRCSASGRGRRRSRLPLVSALDCSLHGDFPSARLGVPGAAGQYHGNPVSHAHYCAAHGSRATGNRSGTAGCLWRARDHEAAETGGRGGQITEVASPDLVCPSRACPRKSESGIPLGARWSRLSREARAVELTRNAEGRREGAGMASGRCLSPRRCPRCPVPPCPLTRRLRAEGSKETAECGGLRTVREPTRPARDSSVHSGLVQWSSRGASASGRRHAQRRHCTSARSRPCAERADLYDFEWAGIGGARLGRPADGDCDASVMRQIGGALLSGR